MKCIIYGYLKSEVVLPRYQHRYSVFNNRALHAETIGEKLNLIKDLNYELQHIPTHLLFFTKNIQKGHIPYKEIENVDENILNKIDKIKIDGFLYNIDNVVYNVDNNVLECYINKIVKKEELSYEEKNKKIEEYKNNYIKKLLELIKKIGAN